MINALLQWLGFNGKPESEKYEPVFGLPKESLEEWLSRHPSMKEWYADELARTTQRTRRRRKENHPDVIHRRSPFVSDPG